MVWFGSVPHKDRAERRSRKSGERECDCERFLRQAQEREEGKVRCARCGWSKVEFGCECECKMRTQTQGSAIEEEAARALSKRLGGDSSNQI